MVIASLETQLSEANKLLALAEDVIIGLRSGIGTPPTRQEGVLGRERDKAGLRAMLYGTDAGLDLGKEIWYETTSPSFFARITPAETTTLSSTQPSLPAELLHEIVALSDRESLPNLCLASTVLREIASPVLYKNLSIKSTRQLEPFSLPPVSARFAEQRHSLTLDQAVVIHFNVTSGPSQIEELLRSSQTLLSSLDPLSISFNTLDSKDSSEFDCPIVDERVWTTISANWQSLRRVVCQGCLLLDQSINPLLWHTIQPTHPLLEIDLIEANDLDSALGEIVTQFFYSLKRATRRHPFGPLPTLTIRLPSEDDRSRLTQKLSYYEAMESIFDPRMKDAVRLVVGEEDDGRLD